MFHAEIPAVVVDEFPGYSRLNNTRLFNDYDTGNSISDCENKCNSNSECVAFLESPPESSYAPCYLYNKNCQREASSGWTAFIKNNASVANSSDVDLQKLNPSWPSDPINDVCPPTDDCSSSWLLVRKQH